MTTILISRVTIGVALRAIGDVRRLVLGRLGVWNVITATTNERGEAG